MKIIDAYWEQENLGVRATEVVLGDNGSLKELIAIQARLDAEYQYICLKTNVNNSELLFSLSSLGYSFVETQFHLKAHCGKENASPELLELANLYEGRILIEDVCSDGRFQRLLACVRDSRMFITDRVFLDPEFPDGAAGNRYARWCEGLYGDGARFFETIIDGQVTGFGVLERKSATAFSSPLGGTYHNMNDYAFLAPIITHQVFKRLSEEGCRTITTSVSSNNKAMLKFHLMAGYELSDMEYVYVKHNKVNGR